MKINLDAIRPDKYQRAFAFKFLAFALPGLAYYRKLDFLIIYKNEFLSTFLPTSMVKKTLKQGRRIWVNKQRFSRYHKNFKQVLKECDKYLKKATNLKEITLKDWIGVYKLIEKFYSFYSKTEFFYADSGYQKANRIIKKRMQTVAKLKWAARKYLNDLAINTLFKYVEKTAKKFNLDPDLVRFSSMEETAELFRTGKRIDEKVIARRKRGYVIYCHNGKPFILGPREEKIIHTRFEEKFEEKKSLNIREFKGIIANKGLVKGKARIILADYRDNYKKFLHEVHEMKNGEILITETSSPEFLPAMKKAKAIITNQGGLGSHAAITSREMKIPCLVGVENATEILKTGDLVQVDANKGLVKIIKRAKK